MNDKDEVVSRLNAWLDSYGDAMPGEQYRQLAEIHATLTWSATNEGEDFGIALKPLTVLDALHLTWKRWGYTEDEMKARAVDSSTDISLLRDAGKLSLPTTPPAAAVPERMAPVQGFDAGIPWSMHLEAYAAYCKEHRPQPALIEGKCRGGFGAEELDDFIPGWRERLKSPPTPSAAAVEIDAGIGREALGRAFCKHHGMDPDFMVNPDGNGVTFTPAWQIFVDGITEPAEDEISLAVAAVRIKPVKLFSSNNIKPCPKCGDEDMSVDSSSAAEASWIECGICEYPMQQSCCEETLVRRWNKLPRTKAPPTPSAGVSEAGVGDEFNILYAIRLPDGGLAMDGPYVLATDGASQSGRMAYARGGEAIPYAALRAQPGGEFCEMDWTRINMQQKKWTCRTCGESVIRNGADGHPIFRCRPDAAMTGGEHG